MAEDQNKKRFLQGLLGTEDYDSTAIRGLLGIAAGALQPGVTSTGQALGAGLAGGLGQIDVARQQQAATALRAAQMDKLKAETKALGNPKLLTANQIGRYRTPDGRTVSATHSSAVANGWTPVDDSSKIKPTALAQNIPLLAQKMGISEKEAAAMLTASKEPSKAGFAMKAYLTARQGFASHDEALEASRKAESVWDQLHPASAGAPTPAAIDEIKPMPIGSDKKIQKSGLKKGAKYKLENGQVFEWDGISFRETKDGVGEPGITVPLQ